MKRLALFGALCLVGGPAFAAAISIDALIDLVIWLVIAGVIYWLALWLLAEIAPAEPFNKAARVILAVIVFVIVLNALLGLVGHSFVSFR